MRISERVDGKRSIYNKSIRDKDMGLLCSSGEVLQVLRHPMSSHKMLLAMRFTFACGAESCHRPRIEALGAANGFEL